MKSFFSILLAAISILACTIHATAVSEDQGLSMGSLQMSADNMVVVELEVADDQFPGMIFTGTAESVYEQMKALKPEAFSDVDDEDIVQPRPLRKRATLNCEWGTDVFGPRFCNDGYIFLNRLGTAKCCVRAELNHCARVSCSYNCGVFLCNKRSTDFCPFCSDIAKDIKAIQAECDCHSFNCPAGARDFDDHFVGISMDKC